MNSALPNTEIVLHVLLSVGIIVIVAKYFGVLAKKIGIPQVAGMIVAGLVLRFIPFFRNYGKTDPNVIYNETNQFISYMSEIGVILIMFSAGLGTNIKSLMKSGFKATIIATSGVFIPLILGTIMAMCFFGFDSWGSLNFFKSVFILVPESYACFIRFYIENLQYISCRIGLLRIRNFRKSFSSLFTKIMPGNYKILVL